MTASTVLIQVIVLAVTLESDLGRRKIGWFRVLRPVISVAAIAPFFFTSVPTSGNSVILQSAGAVLGLGIGAVSVSGAFVSIEHEPRYRGWLARLTHRPAVPAMMSRCGIGYAVIWAAVSVGRLAFAYASEHIFPAAMGTFMAAHQLSPDALANAFIFLSFGMGIARSALLVGRAYVATRSASAVPAAQPAILEPDGTHVSAATRR
ncbi:hypothetical protein Athai_46940 [Actinocatenispora thailandica]|uniref:Uncharacterized protein n=1 Tax=Actinocatenispora thailandica TaxID=227318 RepID=A0A7R7HZ32_9ACTN|nr:hypothetical protein [Actinocatenispora thailandica]BCJ37191.1 hypothetical protein Athai_46940 [Actinocatenispora thailandica]